MHAARVRLGIGSLGFRCRGVSGAVAVAHGPFVGMEVEQWLGENFTTGVVTVRLPIVYATAIKLAIESGALLAEAVPGEVVLDDAQLLYVTSLLQSVVDDVVAATAGKEGALKIGAADRAHFKKWMELRYTSDEDVMLETPSKALSEGEQQQLRMDLNAQDMESLSEFAWFTLTVHGSRATSAGTAGACYMQSPVTRRDAGLDTPQHTQ